MAEIHCTGQISGIGKISIDPALIEAGMVGAKVELTITIPERDLKEKGRKKLSQGARRLLFLMENARPLGVPEDPEELSHPRLAEERIEEKFPWLG